MSELAIDCSKVCQKLEGFINSTITEVGYSRAVIGLSGGIDSALSCYLTARAIGAANVLAIRMPYTTSSSDSLEHAQLVINALGVNNETIPIAEMVDPLIACFPGMNAIRKGNIMARSRMIILFDRSADYKGLVVGTGNKTEALLGYTTLYGDSACALNPLGDLYKTQVRQLSRYLGIPEVIINKPPSADLWKGQTDEGELGFTYEEVDKLLFQLVDKRLTAKECIEKGFPEDFVNKVVGIIRRTRFKRTLPSIGYLESDYNFVNDKKWGL